MAFRRAKKPKPYNVVGKKPKQYKGFRILKDGAMQHWDKTANGNRGGWRPKRSQMTGSRGTGRYSPAQS
jgi:hypothetical protein